MIEVLEDGPSLVLQPTDEDGIIQPNAYGDARRRVPQTFTVQVLSDDGTGLHVDYLALDLLEFD